MVSLGKRGENLACAYLEDNSYEILGRNYSRPWGELDIIARSPNGTLVFVEVKTTKDYGDAWKPEDQMTYQKRDKFKRIARSFAGANPELVNDEKGYRLDLIALVKDEEKFRLRHYKNIT